MRRIPSIRLGVIAAVAVGLCAPAAMGLAGGRGQPGGRRGNRPEIRPGIRQGPSRPRGNQEHLQEWLDRHQGLSMQEQLRQLENEPGFRDLPPETQQRYRNRLIQLNTMSPEQRDRLLQRNEALERLSVPEREEYRAAVQRFAVAPPDRRRMMARAIIELRSMPPDQRQSIINSDRFRGEFSDAERSTLTSLLSVEPYGSPQANR